MKNCFKDWSQPSRDAVMFVKGLLTAGCEIYDKLLTQIKCLLKSLTAAKQAFMSTMTKLSDFSRFQKK